MISQLKFIHFLTATSIIEVIMLFLFRFTTITRKTINSWYDNLGWTAVILDVLSILIGFYLARFLYNYLVKNKYITQKKDNTDFLKFLVLVLMIQILHDFIFYFKVIKPTRKGINTVIDEFKYYAEDIKQGAVIADSIIYLITTPLLYYIIKNNNDDVNIFTTIFSFYLIGYFLHQKPLYNK